MLISCCSNVTIRVVVLGVVMVTQLETRIASNLTAAPHWLPLVASQDRTCV